MLWPTRNLLGSAMIRRVCALAGLLMVLLQGSSGGHMLLVEHSRCAEHGELVHAGESHHHEGVSRVETQGPTYQNAPDYAADETHDHCALAADRHDALGAVSDAQISPFEAGAQWQLRFADRFVPVDTQRFRVAPKNSPPA